MAKGPLAGLHISPLNLNAAKKNGPVSETIKFGRREAGGGCCPGKTVTLATGRDNLPTELRQCVSATVAVAAPAKLRVTHVYFLFD